MRYFVKQRTCDQIFWECKCGLGFWLFVFIALCANLCGGSEVLGPYSFDVEQDWADNYTVVHDSDDSATDGFVYEPGYVRCFDGSPNRDGGWAVHNVGELDVLSVKVSSDVRWSGTNNTDTVPYRRFSAVTLLGNSSYTYFAGWSNATDTAGISDKFVIGKLSYIEQVSAYQYEVLAEVSFPTYGDLWAGLDFSAEFDEGRENVTLTANFYSPDGNNDQVLSVVRNLAADGLEDSGTVGIARPGTYNGYGWFDNFSVEYEPIPEPPVDFDILQDWVLDVNDSYLVWSVNGGWRVPMRGFRFPEQIWDGSALRVPDAGEVKDAMSISSAGASSIGISACIGEYEPVQLILSPKNGLAIDVNDVSITDFVRSGGGAAVIGSENVKVEKVGYLWGVNEWTGEEFGPYSDVLFPVQWPMSEEAGNNFILWLTVYVPRSALPGDYSSTVSIQFNGVNSVSIPLDLEVWAFGIPKEVHLDTQLFDIDKYALCYQYGLAPWQDEYKAIADGFSDILMEHRISPSKTPVSDRIEYEKYPSDANGTWGRYLQFRDQVLELPGPKDELFTEGFTVAFWLKTYDGCEGNILMQNWYGRPSGYWLTMTDGNMEAKIGLGNASPEPTTASTSASWFGHNVWRHVALVYTGAALQLYYDGNMVSSTPVSYDYSASLTCATAGGVSSKFDLDEIRWIDRALNSNEISAEMNSSAPLHCVLKSLDFESSEYDFTHKVVAGQSSEELDQDFFWQKLDERIEKNHFLNNLPQPYLPDEDYVDIPYYTQWCYQEMANMDVLDKGFVKLPRDETVLGTGAEQNRTWADAYKASMPEMKRLHTFGAMGLNTWAEREQAIQEYIGYVDIWSMVPYLFNVYYDDYFLQRQQAGDKFSMYIHRVDEVEEETVLLGTRIFSWYFWKYGLDMCTYWRVNLWFQCVKPGLQPERRTWQVPGGIKTTRRNNIISNGALFWPGEDEIFNSLRVENWRDGFEDFEYVWMLQDAVTEAYSSGDVTSDIVDANSLLDEIKQMEIYGYNWDVPPTKDPALVFYYRDMVADALEAVSESSNFSDVNVDGVVDFRDVAVLGEWWGESCGSLPFCNEADIDGTGSVDVEDLAILANSWLWEASWRE